MRLSAFSRAWVRSLDRNPIGAALLLLVACFAAAWAGNFLLYVPEAVPALWAPTGIALFAALRRPHRKWWQPLLPLLLAVFGNSYIEGADWRVAAGIAGASGAEFLVAIGLLRLRGLAWLRADRPREMLLFVGPIAVLAAAAAALGGTWILVLRDPMLDFSALFRVWWFGHLIGLITVTPFLLAWRRPLHTWRQIFAGPRAVEAIVLLAGLVAIQAYAVAYDPGLPESRYGLLYLPFPALVWLAVRFAPPGGALAALALSLAGFVTGFVVEIWPFSRDAALYALPLEASLTIGSAIAVVLSAVAGERERHLRGQLRSDARYRLLAELSTDIISRHALDTTIRYASPAVAATLGYGAAEMRGKRLLDFVHRDDRDNVENCFRALAGGAAQATMIYRVQRRDGREVWLETIGRATASGAGGEPAAIVGVSRDVTARQRYEAELRDTQELLRRTQRLASLGHWLWVPHEKPWHVAGGSMQHSEEAAQIFGSTSLEFSALSPAEFRERFVHPDDRATVAGAFCAFVENGGGSYPIQYRIRRPNGEQRWIQELATVQSDRQGEPVCIIGTVQDITERKAIEADLQMTKDQAELANRSKSEFLANMSHELRTPLNAVIGFAEVMLRQAFGPLGNVRYRDYAQDIAESGKHLLAVINEILDISRIEAGRLQLWEEAVDLERIVGSCVRLTGERAASAGLQITANCQAGLPLFQGDPTKLKQMLINLLSNAIKFTPPSGSVSVTLGGGADGDFQLEIRDTGIGMRPEDVPIALAPFRQIDGSMARRHEGAGLGLPLSKGFAELHGGSLTILSEPGKGTIVRITLPASRCIAGTDEPALERRA